MLVDITSREAPTLSALLELQDAAGFVACRKRQGDRLVGGYRR